MFVERKLFPWAVGFHSSNEMRKQIVNFFAAPQNAPVHVHHMADEFQSQRTIRFIHFRCFNLNRATKMCTRRAEILGLWSKYSNGNCSGRFSIPARYRVIDGGKVESFDWKRIQVNGKLSVCVCECVRACACENFSILSNAKICRKMFCCCDRRWTVTSNSNMRNYIKIAFAVEQCKCEVIVCGEYCQREWSDDKFALTICHIYYAP